MTEAHLASMAGSELPWWSPIAVSVVLAALALVERRRQRRRGPLPGGPETPVDQLDSPSSAGPCAGFSNHLSLGTHTFSAGSPS